MNKIMKTAQAGTLESNDIMITIAPAPENSGLEIDLTSIVMIQYGETIRRVIAQTVKEAGIRDARIKAEDRGALDCTIKARVLAALARANAAGKEGVQ